MQWTIEYTLETKCTVCQMRACVCKGMYRDVQNITYTHSLFATLHETFPASNTVYASHSYGSGQSYMYVRLNITPQPISLTHSPAAVLYGLIVIPKLRVCLQCKM
jgi:hypothetical protein